MAKIELSIDYVFKNEGGYCLDEGIPSNFGLPLTAVATYRKVPPSGLTISDMQRLTKVEATEIYREFYWNKLSLDFVNDQNIATCIFDTGVNHGIAIGAKYAQRTAMRMGYSVIIDGLIANQSISAINQCFRPTFINYFEALVWSGYEAIIANDPAKYAKYRGGWEARSKRLLTLI